MSYFTTKPNIGDVDLKDFKTLTKATYNEEKLLVKVLEQDTQLLLCCAIQMSIVGIGRGELGSFLIGSVKHDVREILTEAGFKLNSGTSAALSDEDLTPRRLMRLLRYQIQDYMRDNPNVESYLFRKYKVRGAKREFVYPGAEHHIVNVEDAKMLIKVYELLDERHDSTVAERATSVFEARGIMV